MKKKMSTRIISLILVVVMLVPLTMAFAKSADNETQIMPLRYTAITTLYANLTISSTGLATCTGRAEIADGYTGYMTVSLKKTDGSLVKAWNANGTRSMNLKEYWQVASGNSYYVSVYVAVYDSSNGHFVEGATATSNIASY